MGYPNSPDTNAIATSIKAIQEGMPTSLVTFSSTPITASVSPQVVTPSSMLGITVGMSLNVDVSNPETVTVTATTPTTFSAVFAKNHGLLGNNWTVGTGVFSYNTVKIGAITDPTDILAYCSITFQSGTTTRFSSGWRVDDRPRFTIESGFDMTDAVAAERQMLTVRDAMLPIYFSSISLNATPGVYLTLMNEPDKALYKLFPNGRVYRVHLFTVQALAQYNVQVSN